MLIRALIFAVIVVLAMPGAITVTSGTPIYPVPPLVIVTIPIAASDICAIAAFFQ